MFQLCHEINYSAGNSILITIFFLPPPFPPLQAKKQGTDHEILKEALANMELSLGGCLLSFLHVTRALELWVELLNFTMLLKAGR